jgi:type I restriction enzyme R subunit
LSKRIETKWDENPAYYKKFSERIEEAIQAYKDKRISEAEYLERMKEILRDYRSGASGVTYPDNIRNNLNAQAFYGVTNEIIRETSAAYEVNDHVMGELAQKITEIIEKHSKVDWHANTEVHNRIAQELDDLLYDFYRDHNLEPDYDRIDKIIEHVKTVALSRY